MSKTINDIDYQIKVAERYWERLCKKYKEPFEDQVTKELIQKIAIYRTGMKVLREVARGRAV